jgi:hypothetical protein
MATEDRLGEAPILKRCPKGLLNSFDCSMIGGNGCIHGIIEGRETPDCYHSNKPVLNQNKYTINHSTTTPSEYTGIHAKKRD